MKNNFYTPTENEKEQDLEFLVDVLFQIRDYALAHEQEPDETLRTVADWILGLLEVVTFNGGADE